MRVALNMIDLAAPYITIHNQKIKKGKLNIEWKIGGSINVDQTSILTFRSNQNCDPKKMQENLHDMFIEKDGKLTLNKELYSKNGGDSELVL